MSSKYIPPRDGAGLARLRAHPQGEAIRQRVLAAQKAAEATVADERRALDPRQPLQGEYPYPVGTLVWGAGFKGVVWEVLGPLGHTVSIHGGTEIIPASMIEGFRIPSPALKKILKQLRKLGFV